MATRGFENFSMSDAVKHNLDRRASKQPQKRAMLPQERRSKYRAVKTTVHGITFHSKKEAQRYEQLLWHGHLGYVRNLELQPRFPLRVTARDAPVTMIIGAYVADFRYEERVDFAAPWADVVEDCKGWRTPLYKLKKKHFEAQYGITIRET